MQVHTPSFISRLLRNLPGLVFLLVTILALSLSSPVLAIEETHELKNILLLNSCHQGFAWTDDVTRGIVSALGPASRHTRLYIEHMNTKWADDDKYLTQLLRLMKIKYATTRFELIVCSDTDAFVFLREHRDELFCRVPVVFCGVNYYRPEDLQGKRLFTGVSEVADVGGTLDLAFKLHPGTREVLIINDVGKLGIRMKEEMEKLFRHYRNVRFRFEESRDLDRICRDVARLPDKLTAVLGNISLAKVYLDPAAKAHARLVEAEKGCERAAGLTRKLITFAKGGAPVGRTSSIGSVLVPAAEDMPRGTAVTREFSLPDGLWPVEIDRGPGISKENLPRIFDPYFTTRQDGSGLRLATAYSIISKHNGHLEVETAIGVGTVFHVYLPASERQMDCEADGGDF